MSYDRRMETHNDAAPSPEPRTWYTVQQVAERLQVNPVTVLRWIRQGELPYLDLGGRKAGYRVRAEDLDAWERARFRDAGERSAPD